MEVVHVQYYLVQIIHGGQWNFVVYRITMMLHVTAAVTPVIETPSPEGTANRSIWVVIIDRVNSISDLHPHQCVHLQYTNMTLMSTLHSIPM